MKCTLSQIRFVPILANESSSKSTLHIALPPPRQQRVVWYARIPQACEREQRVQRGFSSGDARTKQPERRNTQQKEPQQQAVGGGPEADNTQLLPYQSTNQQVVSQVGLHLPSLYHHNDGDGRDDDERRTTERRTTTQRQRQSTSTTSTSFDSERASDPANSLTQ